VSDTALVKLGRFKWETASYPIPSTDALIASSRFGLDSETPEQSHEFESAGALLDRLERTIREWRAKLPSNAQPLIEAIVPGGWVVVCEFMEQGHNGIAIRGKAGNRDCLLLVHQANLQLLCTIEKLDDEKKRTPIGFVRLGGKRTEA
jgi:hypothetical protein